MATKLTANFNPSLIQLQWRGFLDSFTERPLLWAHCGHHAHLPSPLFRPSSRVLRGKKSILFIAPYEVVTARSSSLLCAQFGPVVMWNILMMTASIARRLPTHSSVFAVPRGIQVISRTLTYDALKHFSFLSRLWLGFVTFFRHIVMDNSSRETNK